MVTRLLLLFIALCASASASACATADPVEFAIVRMNADGELRLYSSAPPTRDMTAWVQVAGPDEGTICCRPLKLSSLRQVEEEGVIAIDKATGNAMNSFVGPMPSGWRRTAFVGIAAIGKGIRAKGNGTRIDVTNAGGAIVSADLCTSQEGVHLLSPPATGTKAHLYLWLGYDIEEPTCRFATR